MSPTTQQTPTGDVMCASPASPPTTPPTTSPVGVAVAVACAGRFPAIFPPGDADAATRRDWLASSPWPEVVFASAG